MRGSTAGISDNFKSKNRGHYILLSILDTVISSLIIGPLVVGYWRGLWSIMDHYVYPGEKSQTAKISLIAGTIGHLTLTLIQTPMARGFNPSKHRLTYYIASRAYTMAFGFSCINFWRGIFEYLELYIGHNIPLVWTCTAIASSILASLKLLRNISAPPFAVANDNYEGYFEVPTMFKINGVQETSLYVLDCVFSVLVIGTLVVFVWRGVWALLDIYLYPQDIIWSSWSSLVLGYSIVVLVFVLQTPMKFLCEKLTGFPRLVMADIYLFLSFCGTVNVWRGIWELLNIYFLPENPELSYWITHVSCLLVLILLNCSNSILVRGVYIDAEEEGGKCVVFPCYYLRLYFQTKRKEKQQKVQLQHLKKQYVAARRKSDVEKCPYPEYEKEQQKYLEYEKEQLKKCSYPEYEKEKLSKSSYPGYEKEQANSMSNHHVHVPLIAHHIIKVGTPEDSDA